jgi:hypothetical protein
LAYDPFIQQLLQSPSKPSVDPHKESSVLWTSKFALDPDSADLLNAIDTGIRSDPEQHVQRPTCSSGNCTWEGYSTTVWCSKCQDATSYAKIIDCNYEGYLSKTDQLNQTDSCSIDLGRGDKFQVMRSEETSEDYIGIQAFTIYTAAVWSLGMLDSNLSFPFG